MARQEDIEHTLMVGAIAQMPAEDQAKINEIAGKLREIVGPEGGRDGHALMAFALVGTEIAKEA